MKALSVLALLSSFYLIGCKKDELNKVPVADAGSAQATQLPKDSVTLTGTGTDKDGTVVGYLWSKVSGPGQAIILDPGSASTTVKGLVTGSYLFQLMVTDNQGATGLDTVRVTVTAAPIQTITLQPSNNQYEGMIALLGTTDVTDNTAAELDATTWTNGSVVYVRSPFRFDLSAIPSTATVISAKLTLYSNPTPLNGDLVHANAGPDNSFLIQRATSAWNNTVKWATQPTTETANQIVVPHTNQAFLDLVDLDVTEMVKKMVAQNNYGFLMKLQNEVIYNSRIFCSSKHANAAKHPKLVVVYQ